MRGAGSPCRAPRVWVHRRSASARTARYRAIGGAPPRHWRAPSTRAPAAAHHHRRDGGGDSAQGSRALRMSTAHSYCARPPTTTTAQSSRNDAPASAPALPVEAPTGRRGAISRGHVEGPCRGATQRRGAPSTASTASTPDARRPARPRQQSVSPQLRYPSYPNYPNYPSYPSARRRRSFTPRQGPTSRPHVEARLHPMTARGSPSYRYPRHARANASPQPRGVALS